MRVFMVLEKKIFRREFMFEAMMALFNNSSFSWLI